MGALLRVQASQIESVCSITPAIESFNGTTSQTTFEEALAAATSARLRSIYLRSN